MKFVVRPHSCFSFIEIKHQYKMKSFLLESYNQIFTINLLFYSHIILHNFLLYFILNNTAIKLGTKKFLFFLLYALNLLAFLFHPPFRRKFPNQIVFYTFIL